MSNHYYIEFLGEGEFSTRVDITREQYEEKLKEMNRQGQLERHESSFNYALGKETLIWFSAPAWEVSLGRFEVWRSLACH